MKISKVLIAALSITATYIALSCIAWIAFWVANKGEHIFNWGVPDRVLFMFFWAVLSLMWVIGMLRIKEVTKELDL